MVRVSPRRTNSTRGASCLSSRIVIFPGMGFFISFLSTENDMGITINTPGQKPDLRTLIILLMCVTLAMLLSSCGPRQVVSAPPAVLRPASPYAGAVWVERGYRTRNRSHVSMPGYYTSPPPGRVYVGSSKHQSRRTRHWTRVRWR